jgi:hypothetical protein
VTRLSDRVVSWRQPPEERQAQAAFLADIDAHWQPSSPRERLLERRSRLVHLFARLFDGPESLAPVAVSLLPTAMSTGLLTMAGPPNRAEYASTAPVWGYALLTAGLVGLAFEAARSPRAVRPVRWSLLGAGPIAAGSLASAYFIGRELVPDRIVAVGFALITIGMAVLAALPFVHSQRLQVTLLRRGMVTSGAGALVTVIGDVLWTPLFHADGDLDWAVGTGLASIGALLLGLALIRSRPRLVPDSRPGTTTSG